MKCLPPTAIQTMYSKEKAPKISTTFSNRRSLTIFFQELSSQSTDKHKQKKKIAQKTIISKCQHLTLSKWCWVITKWTSWKWALATTSPTDAPTSTPASATTSWQQICTRWHSLHSTLTKKNAMRKSFWSISNNTKKTRISPKSQIVKIRHIRSCN